jgi:hypothetical protein
MRGTTELGGTIGFSRLSSDDVTLTEVSVNPFVGIFVAPSFAILGTLLVDYRKFGDEDSTTDIGLLTGAGYFLPAGSIYIGPTVQIGYSRVTPAPGADAENAFLADAQLLLKLKIGSGGLANIGGGYRYTKVFGDNGYSLNGLMFGLGFSVWF